MAANPRPRARAPAIATPLHDPDDGAAAADGKKNPTQTRNMPGSKGGTGMRGCGKGDESSNDN